MTDATAELSLTALDVDGAIALNHGIRQATDGAACLEEAAQSVAEYLREALQDDGGPACPLVRLYLTVRARHLPPELRDFASGVLGRPAFDRLPCLTLLGTAGAEPAWGDRRSSVHHQAIPLVSSAEVDAQIPMVAGLLDQLDVEVDEIADLEPEQSIYLHHREYGIFHVPDAVGSPLIPGQDFVARYGIRSVVGCGGALPSGELFAVVLFSTSSIDARTAQLFRTVAYGIKAALVPFTFRVFG